MNINDMVTEIENVSVSLKDGGKLHTNLKRLIQASIEYYHSNSDEKVRGHIETHFRRDVEFISGWKSIPALIQTYLYDIDDDWDINWLKESEESTRRVMSISAESQKGDEFGVGLMTNSHLKGWVTDCFLYFLSKTDKQIRDIVVERFVWDEGVLGTSDYKKIADGFQSSIVKNEGMAA